MPLYELFCLARPAGGQQALAHMIRAAGQAVLNKGGVLTDVAFFGEQPLAYEIRKAGSRFDKADIWQLQFKAAPGVLADVEHNLKVDERVLRYIVQKQPAMPTLPNTHNVQMWARRVHGQGQPLAAD